VMLYEMIAGQRPFRGDTVVAQISSILVDEPPALADACPGVPADLARVVHACLARRVEDRVQSATEVREQLLRIRAAIVLPRGSAAEMGGAAGAMPNSIAVLPFTNMSADREQEYFCDGIAEEIINALTRLEGLRVVARTSAFAFKGLNEDVRGIGRKLDVGAVLEGSVRKSGERLRITAQLVNVADGYHLWSQRFDRHLDDIFDIQDEISLAIVDRLKVTLLDAERLRLTRRHTVDRDAYDLYLRGRYIVNQRRGDIATAIALFRQAIERDPGFALPHLGLAEMGLFRAIWGIEPPPKVLAEAKAAAARGLELDEESGDAHVIAGFLEVLDGRDWRPAVRHFRRGLDLGFTRPQSYFLYAMFLGACGDTDRAIAMAEQSHLIDPLSAVSFMGLGTNLAIAGRLDEAALMEQRALELEPAMIPAATWLGWIEILRGRYEEATGPLQLAIDEGLTFAYGLLGLALGLGGHREDARATLARAHEVARSRYVTLAVDSLILTGLGETDSAMDALAAAWTESNPPTGLVLLDTPVFRFLPAHPRLAEFRARLAALRAGARDASGRW
jgi:adenylate cyclase